MYSKRTDANQVEIVKALKNAGYSVHDTHALGGGFPDIIVGCGGRVNILMEIKTEKGELNKKEKEFFSTWLGPVYIVRSPEDALLIMNVQMLCRRIANN